MCTYVVPESFVDKFNACTTKEKLEHICSQFIPDFVTNQQYRVVGYAERNHEEGTGGYNRFKNTLLKDGEPVLISIQRIGWYTYSDDSEDYIAESVQETYLFQNDPIAKKIFEAIKEAKNVEV